MLSYNAIQIYVRERLSFFPWFIIPLYIFFLAHGPLETFNLKLLYPLLMAIIFFRTLDDIFCWDFDQRMKKSSLYLTLPRLNVVILCLISGFLYLSGFYFVSDIAVATLNIFFVFFNISLYFILKKTKLIIYVSMLKYLFLFLLVMQLTSETNPIWGMVGSLLFIFREILEEQFKIKNLIITTNLFLIPLLIKYTLRYLV